MARIDNKISNIDARQITCNQKRPPETAETKCEINKANGTARNRTEHKQKNKRHLYHNTGNIRQNIHRSGGTISNTIKQRTQVYLHYLHI